MEAKVAATKIHKYASSESGDTLEMVERPAGGLSFVLADGQRSGKSAKAISNVVTRKAISLLADGVRDGAVCRAASDYLFTYRGGKVLATLNIVSIDLISQSLVIARNNPAPVIVVEQGSVYELDEPVEAIGTRRGIRPAICEFSLSLGLVAIAFTDGLIHAGSRHGQHMDIRGCVQDLLSSPTQEPADWADTLLEMALALDDGRPTDDISILVAAILPNREGGSRRMTVRMPLR